MTQESFEKAKQLEKQIATAKSAVSYVHSLYKPEAAGKVEMATYCSQLIKELDLSQLKQTLHALILAVEQRIARVEKEFEDLP